MSPQLLTWIIAAIATAGVIIRPFGLPEAIWAVAGAVLLVGLRLLSPTDALTGIGKGIDVYLFLAGMMLLAEIARDEGFSIGLRPPRPSMPTVPRAGCFFWSTSSVRS